MMIAGVFHAPLWAITDDEATRVATTFARFSRWYNIPSVPDRIADHYGFMLAMIMVYGTRIVTALNEAKKRPGIVDIKPGPPPRPPGMSTNGAAPEGSGVREPPDPRDWRRVDVDGVGPVDIPPVSGGASH